MVRLFGNDNGLLMGVTVVCAIIGGALAGVIVYQLAEKPLMQRLRRFN